MTASVPHAPFVSEPTDVLPLLSEAEAVTSATWFKALADPTRIRILNLLAQSPDSICFCDIANQFPLGRSTVSHHLKVLRNANLLGTERRGTFMHYQVNQASVTELPEAVHRMLSRADGG